MISRKEQMWEIWEEILCGNSKTTLLLLIFIETLSSSHPQYQFVQYKPQTDVL